VSPRDKSTMEKDQEKTSSLLMPFTSSVGDDVVVNEDVVAAVSATSTSIEGEEGAASASSKEDKKVFASEEQIRAVFSNNLVSL